MTQGLVTLQIKGSSPDLSMNCTCQNVFAQDAESLTGCSVAAPAVSPLGPILLSHDPLHEQNEELQLRSC